MVRAKKGEQIRSQILRELMRRQHSGISELPEVEELGQLIGVSEAVISDQLDILDDMGAIKANRTLNGGAAPIITGSGKLLLEELEELEETSTEEPEAGSVNNEASALTEFEWDVFICHSSEDKDSFVRPLAEALTGYDLKVWYDEFTLKVGDSLRQSIDKGLARSRYGIVVLSPNFFGKDWPQRELDGLVAKERDSEKVILPVWLNVTRDDVTKYSPTLADKLATHANQGIEKVIPDLLEVLMPDKQNTVEREIIDTEISNTTTGKSSVREPIAVTISYSIDSESDEASALLQRMFAILIDWREFDEIEERHLELRFAGGTFEISYGVAILEIEAKDIDVGEVIKKFGKPYNDIRFKVITSFNLGELARRSKKGIRRIVRATKESLTFAIANGRAEVEVANDEEKSVVILRSAGRKDFPYEKGDIPFDLILAYLSTEPPASDLEELVEQLLR